MPPGWLIPDYSGPMLFNVAVQHAGPILLVVGTGPAQLLHLCGLVDLAARVARMGGYRRLLVDLLAVDPELSFTDHLQLGAHAAQMLAGIDKVATVVPREQRKGSSEKAAQQHGLRLRTFSDMHEAENWLREP